MISFGVIQVVKMEGFASVVVVSVTSQRPDKGKMVLRLKHLLPRIQEVSEVLVQCGVM